MWDLITYQFIWVWFLAGINAYAEVCDGVKAPTSLRVTVSNLGLDLHLCVCEPASNPLHEQQVHHVVLESTGKHTSALYVLDNDNLAVSATSMVCETS